MAVVIGPAVPPAIHVMTWNIRRQMPALVARRVDRWEARNPPSRPFSPQSNPLSLGFRRCCRSRHTHSGISSAPHTSAWGRGGDVIMEVKQPRSSLTPPGSPSKDGNNMPSQIIRSVPGHGPGAISFPGPSWLPVFSIIRLPQGFW